MIWVVGWELNRSSIDGLAHSRFHLVIPFCHIAQLAAAELELSEKRLTLGTTAVVHTVVKILFPVVEVVVLLARPLARGIRIGGVVTGFPHQLRNRPHPFR